MADASATSEDALAWAAHWYLDREALRAAKYTGFDR
jgi:hypothetical protein